MLLSLTTSFARLSVELLVREDNQCTAYLQTYVQRSLVIRLAPKSHVFASTLITHTETFSDSSTKTSGVPWQGSSLPSGTDIRHVQCFKGIAFLIPRNVDMFFTRQFQDMIFFDGKFTRGDRLVNMMKSGIERFLPHEVQIA